MPKAQNNQKDKEQLERRRRSDTTVGPGADGAAIEDVPAARSLDTFQLLNRVRKAFEVLLGAEELWIDDLGEPSFSIEATLPIERASIIREPINNQLWRIPWVVNGDDTITILPRANWERVTHEYVPVAAPTQPDTPPQTMRALTGSAVRIVAETPDTITVGGYGVRFFGTDLLGTRFMPDTDFGVYIRSGNLPVYYDHTLTGPPQHSLGTVVKAVPDEDGLWIEAQLNRHAAYVGEVLKLIDQGVLGWSSGSVPHLVRLAGDNSTWQSWPIIEFSLTPTPGEPRTLGVHLVSETQTAARRAPHRSGGNAVDEENTPQEGQQQQGAPAQDAPPAQPTRQQQQQTPANSAPSAASQTPQAAPIDPASMRTMFSEALSGLVEEHIQPLRAQLDEMRGTPAPRGEGGIITSEPEMSNEERAVRSFNNIVRLGPGATRADYMQVSTGEEGGILVPPVYSDQVLAELAETRSIMRVAGANQLTVPGGQPFKAPKRHGTKRAVLTREARETDRQRPTVSEVEFNPYKYTRETLVTDEMLRYARFDVVQNFIVPDVAQAYTDAENEDFLLGTGASMPQGVLTGATVGATSEKATIDYNDVINLLHSMPQQYRTGAVWITNDTTIGGLRKLKGADGHPIWQPSMRDDAPDRLLGKAIFTLDGMPDVEASAKVLLLCNMMYYWIVDFQGMEMKRLNEVYARNGQVGFIWHRSFDGRIVDDNAFRVLQMKA